MYFSNTFLSLMVYQPDSINGKSSVSGTGGTEFKSRVNQISHTICKRLANFRPYRKPQKAPLTRKPESGYSDLNEDMIFLLVIER